MTTGRLAVGIAVVAVALAAGAAPASAERGALVDFTLQLSSSNVSSASGMSVEVVFHTEGDPNEKSSPVRSVVLEGPSGLRINNDAMPKCAASDAELRALGTNACPADTEAGTGSYSAIVGFGPPFDPFDGDNHVFNAERALIEVITFPDTTVSPGYDRLTIDGNTLTANPPVTPGGPPDAETATRSIQFTIPPHVGRDGSLITTPKSCPASGYWESKGSFGFASGQSETVVSRTPCTPASASGYAKARCVRSGRVTMRTPRTRNVRIRRMKLFINGRFVRRVARSARWVRVDLRDGAAGRHKITIRAVTFGGKRRARHRVVHTCDT